jgi:hypothetical protein
MVAVRFSEANNEVMLTSSTEFKQRYEFDLPVSVGAEATNRRSFGESVPRAASHVITGRWETVGGTRAPADEQPTVERTAAWRSSAFPYEPDTGEGLIAQRARYDVHTRPSELLDRARRFTGRPDASFERFNAVSLREYVNGADGVAATSL